MSLDTQLKLDSNKQGILESDLKIEEERKRYLKSGFLRYQ
jgi:hypothetical protein